MTSASLLDRLLNRRIRVSGDNDPLLKERFADRYQWMCLDNLKVSPKVLDRILAQRSLTDQFSLRYDKKLAVIIPFRNRHAHLHRLVPALQQKLQSEGIEHKIFVIDQVDDKLFNRAKLINAGVKLAGDGFDYYCPHDVDMLPMDCTYGCPSAPLRIFTHALSSEGNRGISNVFFSGIISIPKEHFYLVNGFSNNFWHWGKEDDNFLLRLLLKGLNPAIDSKGTISEIDESTDRYTVTDAGKANQNRDMAEKFIRENRKYQQQVARGKIDPFAEGINNVDFETVTIEECAEYVHAQVRL